MNVADNADYGCPRSVIMPSAQLDSFAQRILVREYLASGPFADECHVLVSRGVGLGKRRAPRVCEFPRLEALGQNADDLKRDLIEQNGLADRIRIPAKTADPIGITQ